MSAMNKSNTKKGAKSEATRTQILDASLELFREQGFEETAMREIARKAGVATGAAYYYFASKDAIILAFYQKAQREMAPVLEAILEAPGDFEKKIRAIVQVKLDYFEPSRGLLGALAKHANPSHPLSPFSAETRETRDADMEFFAQVLESAKISIPKDLLPYMPRLLWMYQMGIIFYWIHDRSPGQGNTSNLMDKSLDVVVRMIKLAGLPLTRPLRRKVIDLIEAVMA